MGVISTVKATYQALTVYAQTYVDATPRTAAEAAQRVIAALVTQLRDDMFEISDALAGDMPITAAGITARFAGAPDTGFNAEAAASVTGDGTGHIGNSFYAGAAHRVWIAIRKAGGSALDGYLQYNTGTGTWTIGGAGAARVFLSSAQFSPTTTGAVSLGSASFRWSTLNLSGGPGFYGTAPTTKQAVTGARDDPEAALANLITALVAYGLVTDSTTAS